MTLNCRDQAMHNADRSPQWIYLRQLAKRGKREQKGLSEVVISELSLEEKR